MTLAAQTASSTANSPREVERTDRIIVLNKRAPEQKIVYIIEVASELLPPATTASGTASSKAITFGSRKIATFSPEA